MRIVQVAEMSVPISRYADPAIPSGGLTTSVVALTTDVRRNGKPVVGYGFSSIGRFAQSGLIRERFAPRLLDSGDVDPQSAWDAMMRGEKPGGHGERCVAIGTLDMALWDAAAKIADVPLYALLAERYGRPPPAHPVAVYAGGGYLYPHDDIDLLVDEVHAFLDSGFTHVKIKIGADDLDSDRRRIEALLHLLPASNLAVDTMNRYAATTAIAAANALAPYGLGWFEDICDPLDFETQARVAALYPHAIAAGEALFSAAEARLLDQYAGLRPDRDILLFDPVHCYGIPEYARIIALMETSGWARASFWPHGGHLFSLHVAAAFGLGGSEVNPRSFAPFGGFHEGAPIVDGHASLPAFPE